MTELQLSPEQTQKVDAIYADARPKFMALRDLSPEDRPKARDRIMADTRARIGDLLSPAQKTKYAELVAEAASRTSTRGRIYVMDANGKPRAYNVRLGITDGTSTELLVRADSPEAAVLKEGAEVITGLVTASKAPATGAARPAGAPRFGF